MFNGVFFIISIFLGIGFGIGYNIFIIKEFPDFKRKIAYFSTIIVFLLLSLSMYTIISIRTYVNTIINEYSVKMEHYIVREFPENDFVRNGLDLKGINDDISQINATVAELRSILPTHQELGVNRTIYNLIVDYAMNELQKRLNVVNYSVNVMNAFTDRNNILTVNSIISGLRTNAVKLINTIALIISGVFLITVLIYIIYTLTVVKRERKFKNI